jgi:hypothetical protein
MIQYVNGELEAEIFDATMAAKCTHEYGLVRHESIDVGSGLGLVSVRIATRSPQNPRALKYRSGTWQVPAQRIITSQHLGHPSWKPFLPFLVMEIT